MRRILFLLAFVSASLTSISTSAQYMVPPPGQPLGVSEDGNKVVAPEIFPLGALIGGSTPLDSLQRANINFAGYFYDSHQAGLETVADSIGAIAGGGWFDEYQNVEQNAYLERRMYLFSGWGHPDQRAYDYGAEAGFNRIVADADTGLQYLVNTTDTLPLESDKDTFSNSRYGGSYVLRLPQYQTTAGNGNGLLRKRHYAQYYDFIYRFDTTLVDWAGLSSSQPLYTIEVWVRGAKTASKYDSLVGGTPAWKLYDTVYEYTITKASYQAATNHRGPDSAWWQDDLNALLRRPRSVNSEYARWHIVLDSALMSRYYNAGRDPSDTLASRYKGEEYFYTGNPDRGQPMIDIRIRRNYAIRIYVKGLRMRNGGMELLATGKLDDELKKKFELLASSKYQSGIDTLQGSYYPRLLALNLFNEPYPDKYYVIALLDRYALYHKDQINNQPTYKRFAPFTPFSFEQARLIWDDILWKPTNTTASPLRMYRNIDYQSGQNVYLPIPADVLPKAHRWDLNLFSQKPTLDVEQFDKGHDSILRIGYRDLLRSANETAFRLGSQPVPFWVMGQAYWSIVGKYHDTTILQADNNQRPTMLPSALGYVIRKYQQMLVDPALNCADIGNKIWRWDSIVYADSIGLDRANPTSEEIRLQANLAAVWGAKGFIVSNSGNNGLREIGFSQDNFKHDLDLYDTTAWLSIMQNLDLSDSIRYYQVRKDNIDSVNNWWFTLTDNLPGYVYAASVCFAGHNKYIPYTGDRYCVSLCAPSHTIHLWYPTFYGFKTKYEGVKLGMGDLNRVAKTLAKLTWQSACDFSFSDPNLPSTTPVLMPVQDIGSIIMKKKRRATLTDRTYIDSVDTVGKLVCDDKPHRFLEAGSFIDSTDASARYLYIVNRHVWPNRPLDDNEASDSSLGNVSVRRATFHARRPTFGKDSSFAFWSYTDVASGAESILRADSDYRALLEPGEGRLFRLAPARSHEAGLTSALGMAYNNGHRLAELDTVGADSNRRMMVWERKGKIQFSVINRPRKTTELNFVLPDSARTLDSSGLAVNPSVAAKGDTVAVIYNLVSATSSSGRPVLFARSVFPFTRWTHDTIARVPLDSNKLDQLITPSITGAADGFFCSWSTPNSGIRLRIIRDSAQYLSPEIKVQAEPTATRTIFPSVASRNEQKVTTNIEYLHVAWEERMPDSTSQIYYKRIGHTMVPSQIDSLTSIERVSKLAPSCRHHHPNLALTNLWGKGALLDPDTLHFGQPIVTWEMVTTNRACDSVFDLVTIGAVYVMLRERSDAASGGWGPFTSFYPKRYNLPLPMVRVGYEYGTANQRLTNAKLDVLGIVFQDTAKREVHTERLYQQSDSLVSYAYPRWEHLKLIEPGLYPNLSLAFEPNVEGDVRSITFRGIRATEDSLYSARILAKSTEMEVPVKTQLVHSFEAKDTSKCEAGLRYTIGAGSIGDSTLMDPWASGSPIGGDSTTQRPIEWGYKELSHCNNLYAPPPFYDSTHPNHSIAPYGWPYVEDTIRTNNFTAAEGEVLNMRRLFQIKDTTAIKTLLGSNGAVTFKLILKDSATKTKLFTLDSITIRQLSMQVAHSPCNFAAILWKVPIILPPPPPVGAKYYLTLEMIKDSAIDLALVQTQLLTGELEREAAKAQEVAGAFKRGGKPGVASRISVEVYPNPFNPSASVRINGPSGSIGLVEIYNPLGAKVATLFEGEMPGGPLTLRIDGSELASGNYFLRISCGSEVVTKQIQLKK